MIINFAPGFCCWRVQSVLHRSEGFVTLGAFNLTVGMENVIDASARIAKGQALSNLLVGLDVAVCMLVLHSREQRLKFESSTGRSGRSPESHSRQLATS
jgi:hypothetical protein